MNLKKYVSLVLASAAISTVLNTAVSAEGLKFGRRGGGEPLSVNENNQCLGRTEYDERAGWDIARIELGEMPVGSTRQLYFSVNGQLLHAPLDDYEIEVSAHEAIDPDNKQAATVRGELQKGVDGHLVVSLSAIQTTDAEKFKDPTGLRKWTKNPYSYVNIMIREKTSESSCIVMLRTKLL